MRYQIIDTETAGFKPPVLGSGVCEVSIREVTQDFEGVANYYSLINPQCPIHFAATGVHGIRNSDVEDAPTLQEWLGSVLDQHPWAKNQPPITFIAHNAKFDAAFLSKHIDCEVRYVDTLLLARRYYPDAENHKLATLAVMLDLEEFSAGKAHGAAQDTLVLRAFVRRMCQDTGMTLEALCVDAQRKDPITKMPFGKYRGKLIADVAKTDPNWIKWALRNVDNMDTELRQALTAVL